MSEAMIIALAVVKYGPALGRALYDLFHKTNPTREDFEVIFKIAETPYEDFTKQP